MHRYDEFLALDHSIANAWPPEALAPPPLPQKLHAEETIYQRRLALAQYLSALLGAANGLTEEV